MVEIVSRPSMSLAGDPYENTAESALLHLDTIGQVRAGLSEIRAWAQAWASSEACFTKGYYTMLSQWLDYSEYLLRKSHDDDLVTMASRKMEEALGEVASWSVNLQGAEESNPAPFLGVITPQKSLSY